MKAGTAAQMEKMAGMYRRVKRSEESRRAMEQHQKQSLTYRYDDDDMLVIQGRFTPEQGAMLLKALETADTGPDPVQEISAETSRRLACDASVVPIVTNAEGQTLNIGRKSRSIPPAMWRALHLRDQDCRFPGCTHTRFLDGHHVQQWADGGETSMINLVP